LGKAAGHPLGDVVEDISDRHFYFSGSKNIYFTDFSSCKGLGKKRGKEEKRNRGKRKKKRNEEEEEGEAEGEGEGEGEAKDLLGISLRVLGNSSSLNLGASFFDSSTCIPSGICPSPSVCGFFGAEACFRPPGNIVGS
jgi:hypothetical protein